MKNHLLIATLLLGISLARAETPSLAPPADNPGAPISPASVPTPAASPAPAPLIAPAPTISPVPGATPASSTPASANLPTAGFAPARYEALWVKSPFAVATSETVGEESPDYQLVGVSNQDGVFYASLVERQNQEHFLLTSDKPVRGLTLKSINRTHDGMNTFAELVKDGQPLTLKLEQAPPAAGGVPTAANMGAPGAIPMPNTMAPQISMPGAAGGFPNNGSVRPFTRFHRPPIRLPPGNPVPGGAPAPTTAPAANPPNPTPPPPQ